MWGCLLELLSTTHHHISSQGSSNFKYIPLDSISYHLIPDHLTPPENLFQEKRFLWEERGKQGEQEEEHQQGQEWKSFQQVENFSLFIYLLVLFVCFFFPVCWLLFSLTLILHRSKSRSPAPKKRKG